MTSHLRTLVCQQSLPHIQFIHPIMVEAIKLGRYRLSTAEESTTAVGNSCQALLAPFTTPGYRQYRSTSPERQPFSYTQLQSCGALMPTMTGLVHAAPKPRERQQVCRRVEMGLKRGRGAKRGDVDDGIVVEQAAQRSEQIPEIGARERIAEAIGESQQPASVAQKTEQRLNLLRHEERGRMGHPAFSPGVIPAGGRRNDDQPGLAQRLRQRSLIQGHAGATQSAEPLGQPGEVGVHLARRIARLAPVGLAVRGIEHDCMAGERRNYVRGLIG